MPQFSHMYTFYSQSSLVPGQSTYSSPQLLLAGPGGFRHHPTDIPQGTKAQNPPAEAFVARQLQILSPATTTARQLLDNCKRQAVPSFWSRGEFSGLHSTQTLVIANFVLMMTRRGLPPHINWIGPWLTHNRTPTQTHIHTHVHNSESTPSITPPEPNWMGGGERTKQIICL